MVYEVRWQSRELGIAFKAQLFLKKTLKDYSQAGEADPQFPLAFFCLGLFRKKIRYNISRSRDLDEALEIYRKCVSLDPDCAAAHNNMGLIYVDKKDFEGAEKEFNEILRIFPGHPTGLKNLELARGKKGRGKFF